MRSLKVFNTRNELIDFLYENEVLTLEGYAAFGLDLLDEARANGNEIEIGCDGGWIQIDDMGYVVADFAIC